MKIIHTPHSVQKLINELNCEIGKSSDDAILAKIMEIAKERYKASNATEKIAVKLTKQRVRMMKVQKEFNADYFNDLIEYIIINDNCELQLVTKTNTKISEEK